MAGGRIEAQESLDVLRPPAAAQPLPQRGLSELHRGLGGIHHLDLQAALGAGALRILHTVTELEQCRVNVPGTTARKSLIVLGGFFGRRQDVVKTSEPKSKELPCLARITCAKQP